MIFVFVAGAFDSSLIAISCRPPMSTFCSMHAQTGFSK
ncbi:unnamed protein product, partial [Amoebophrya sp. A120]|eukprot:GSA120T00019953001.1